MEIRVLEYFLAVAREQNISKAADFLHLTQPTLSRQLKDLEKELGKQLFIRGNRKVTLTEDGMFLRKRAEEIIDLVKKTEDEVRSDNSVITGDIFIGAAETDAVRSIIKLSSKLQNAHPGISLHIFSGDAPDTLEKLDKGLIDFALVLGNIDSTKYDYIKLSLQDVWGVLMRKDSELANKSTITAKELAKKPLILSRQSIKNKDVIKWFQKEYPKLNIIATYNLIYNASLMVDEGMGYALGLDKLISMTGNSNLCFIPLEPPLKLDIYIIWKKYQIFSKAADAFLNLIQQDLNQQ
jgi:DNA-binding transcriptional LysR family regulator